MKPSEDRREARRWLDRAAPQACRAVYLTGAPGHALALYRSMNTNEGYGSANCSSWLFD
jgi:hypothetical protein